MHDPEWTALTLWFDSDHDGRSSTAQLLPVALSEMIAIETHHRWSGRRDTHGNQFRYRGEIWLTHGSRRIYDVLLQRSHQ